MLAFMSGRANGAPNPPAPPGSAARANTVQQDERDELARAIARQTLADGKSRDEQERARMAREFASLNACTRRGCLAIRLPPNMIFDNACVQAKIDAALADRCHYHRRGAVEVRDPEGERGETMQQWPCCSEMVLFPKKGGCHHAPAHEFPAEGAAGLQQPLPATIQLAAAVIDSVAAARGDAEAQFRLGRLHSNEHIGCWTDGPNPVFDMAAAAKFYRLAAAQQHVHALWCLGGMYEKGDGVGRDDAEAVKCYRMAADKGLVYAQYSLGVMLEEGRGVERDEAEAIRWYKAALVHEEGGGAKHRLDHIAAFGILQDGSQARDAGALADMLSRLGVKCGADLNHVGYDDIHSIAKLLKPEAARAAFSFAGYHF